MKLQDLDDLTPPEPDEDLLERVHVRTAKLRTRRRAGAVTAGVTAVVLVAAVVTVAWRSSQSSPDRVAVRAPEATGPVVINGTWNPRSVTGYAGPIGNYGWHIAPFLRFDSTGKWAGADGCNDMGGTYELQPSGDFHAEVDGGTTVQCNPPLFPTIDVLRQATRVVRNTDELTFVGGNGQVLATYDRVLDKSESMDYWTQAEAVVRQNGGSPYLSEPVDITRAGHYSLMFGPLRASDASRFERLIGLTGGSSPQPNRGGVRGLGFGTSVPDDVSFSANPHLAGATIFERDGGTYLRLPLDVENFTTEYLGFRMLLQ